MEEENVQYEKILENMPKSIPIDVLEVLIPKARTQICKIECKDGGRGTGFFCNILYDYSCIKALITNNHVLNEDDILLNKKIKFCVNEGKTYYEIIIDEFRKKFTNKKYDITIIEIKQNDKLDGIEFFDIDNQIYNCNPNEKYKNKEIYLLHYPKGEKIEHSSGFIININDNNYTIRHLCQTYKGSSGAPIINSINLQVIGIHRGGAINKNYNLGVFLKEPIKMFIEEIKTNIKINSMFSRSVENGSPGQ